MPEIPNKPINMQISSTSANSVSAKSVEAANLVSPQPFNSQVLAINKQTISISVPGQAILVLDISENKQLQQLQTGQPLRVSLELTEQHRLNVSISKAIPPSEPMAEVPLSRDLANKLADNTSFPAKQTEQLAFIEKNSPVTIGLARRMPGEMIKLVTANQKNISAALPNSSRVPLNQTYTVALIIAKDGSPQVQFTSLPQAQSSIIISNTLSQLTENSPKTDLTKLLTLTTTTPQSKLQDIATTSATNGPANSTNSATGQQKPVIDMSLPRNQLWLRHQPLTQVMTQLAQVTKEVAQLTPQSVIKTSAEVATSPMQTAQASQGMPATKAAPATQQVSTPQPAQTAPSSTSQSSTQQSIAAPQPVTPGQIASAGPATPQASAAQTVSPSTEKAPAQQPTPAPQTTATGKTASTAPATAQIPLSKQEPKPESNVSPATPASQAILSGKTATTTPMTQQAQVIQPAQTVSSTPPAAATQQSTQAPPGQTVPVTSTTPQAPTSQPTQAVSSTTQPAPTVQTAAVTSTTSQVPTEKPAPQTPQPTQAKNIARAVQTSKTAVKASSSLTPATETVTIKTPAVAPDKPQTSQVQPDQSLANGKKGTALQSPGETIAPKGNPGNNLSLKKLNALLASLKGQASAPPADTQLSPDNKKTEPSFEAVMRLQSLTKQLQHSLPGMRQLTSAPILPNLIEQFVRFDPLAPASISLSSLGSLASALQLLLGGRSALASPESSTKSLSPELTAQLKKILQQGKTSHKGNLLQSLAQLGNFSALKSLEETLTSLSGHLQLYQYQSQEQSSGSQQMFYFTLPTSEPALPQVEGQIEHQSDPDDPKVKTWQLTLLLPVGATDKIKASARLQGTNVEIELVSNSDEIVTKAEFFSGFLSQRLISLGLTTTDISCKRAELPKSLLKRPNQLVELII